MLIIFTIIQLPLVIFANNTVEVCEKHDHLMISDTVLDHTTKELKTTFSVIYQTGLVMTLQSFENITVDHVVGATEIADSKVLFALDDPDQSQGIKFKICSFESGTERCDLLDDANLTNQQPFNRYITTTDEHDTVYLCYGNGNLQCAALEKVNPINENERFRWNNDSLRSTKMKVGNNWWIYRQEFSQSQDQKICTIWWRTPILSYSYNQAMCVSINETNWMKRRKIFESTNDYRKHGFSWDHRNWQIMYWIRSENFTKWTSFNLKLQQVGTYYSQIQRIDSWYQARFHSINGSKYTIVLDDNGKHVLLVLALTPPNDSSVVELTRDLSSYEKFYSFSITKQHCVNKTTHNKSNTSTTTDDNQTTYNKPNTSTTTDDNQTTYNKPNTSTTTDDNQTTYNKPNTSTTTDDNETTYNKPNTSTTTDDNQTTYNEPNTSTTTNDNETTYNKPNTSTTTDDNQTTYNKPNTSTTTDDNQTTYNKPNTSTTTDDNETTYNKPNTSTTTDDNQTTYNEPNTSTTTNDNETTYNKPNTSTTTDDNQTTHNKSNTSTTTDDNQTTYNKPNTSTTTDDNQTTYNKPNTSTTTDDNQTTYNKPNTSTTTDDNQTTYNEPNTSTTTNDNETTYNKPNTSTTTDDNQTTYNKPNTSTTIDDNETTYSKPNTSTTTDDNKIEQNTPPEDSHDGIIYLIVLICTILFGCGFMVFEVKTCTAFYNRSNQFPWFTVKRGVVKDGENQQSLEKSKSMTKNTRSNSDQIKENDKPEEPQKPSNEGTYEATPSNSRSITVPTKSTSLFNVPIKFNSKDDQSDTNTFS